MTLNNIAIKAALALSLATTAHAADRPNFVFLQGEAQGWSSMSIQMDPNNPESKSYFFHTPSLARLGRRWHAFFAFLRAVATLHAITCCLFNGQKPRAAAHDLYQSEPDDRTGSTAPHLDRASFV